MIFRLSVKLNAKVKAGNLAALPLDENPLVDWSAGMFLVRRTQYILLTNTKPLYSTVLPGKDIRNPSDFIERASSSIRELLTANGHEGVYERHIAPAIGTVRFAKALNRSVTGSMNDMTKFAVYDLAEGDISLIDIGTSLNDIPMTALKQARSTHGLPRDAFETMVNEAGS